jgi:HSP20 family protein
MESFFRAPRLRSFFERDIEPEMRMDITEDSKAYHVKAELSGIKKEDIRVEIDGNEVAIHAEVKREREEKKGESVVCSERYHGKQFRRFSLRHEIDLANATAKYEDGVLELVLPKQHAVPAKVVPVR